MAVAFQLSQAVRHNEREVLCRGLVTADHKYGVASLYAASLRQVGRLSEPLAELEKGLAFEPAEPK
jgi:hypothetical protein